MVIERMTKRDVAEVLAIEREIFSSPWTAEMFLRGVDNKDSYFVVARREGKVVGYGGFFMIGKTARLENLAVHPDFRRRGVATELLRELLGVVRANGGSEMTLEVRSENQEAQNLYRKFGFTVSGKHPQFYIDTGEDALVMSKKLNKLE